jgi:epoxyqueuosine reductase
MVKDIIRNNLIPEEDYIYGFSNLHGLIDKKYGDFYYGISIGKKLDDKIIDGIKEGPTIEYYNHYNRINKELAVLTSKIKADLKRAGVDSIAIEPTVTTGTEAYNDEYLRTLKVDISHKMVATRAGLGWIGKSDLFISREFGPRLRLVSMLLNKDPGINTVPVDESECGKCNICVIKCPANAATGKSWNINVQRNEFFDAFKCREKCNELARERLNVDARICGICVAFCPAGKR